MPFWRRQAARQQRFDLAKFGAGARAQLEALGVKSSMPSKRRGRHNVSPKEERTFEGKVFASKWEMQVYVALIAVLGKDKVRTQISFVLQDAITDGDGKEHRKMTYVADFVVGELVLDAKGQITPEFALKEKLFAARYPHPIIRVEYGKKKKLQEVIERCVKHLDQISTEKK